MSSVPTVPSLISDSSTSSQIATVPTPTGAPQNHASDTDFPMLPPPAVQPNTARPHSPTIVEEITSGSQGLSAPSLTAINTLSNPRSRKAKSTSKSAASAKRRRDALDDGDDARSGTVRTFPTCSDIPTPSPSALPSRSSNAASMITLAGAVASLGTSINHQTMTSDIQIANKVQGFINSQDYLTDLEKSLAGEYYAMQSTLSSGLLSMKPSVAKITLQRRVRALARNIEEEMEDVSVGDA